MLLQEMFPDPFQITFCVLMCLSFSASIERNSLKLESHPKNLTCTLYLKTTSNELVSVSEKLIHDNLNSVILCIFSSGNKTIPNQTMSFLEQCTINITVTDKPVYAVGKFLIPSLHSVRESSHSVFIIISSDDCTHHHHGKPYGFYLIIFYYFLSCEDADPSIFPSAFINFLNSTKTTNLVYMKSTTDYSIFHRDVPPIYYTNLSKHQMYSTSKWKLRGSPPKTYCSKFWWTPCGVKKV